MKVVAIIQARTGSTRLPGKVLMDIGGKTMLGRVLERVRLVPGVNEIIVATTQSSSDDPVVAESRRYGVATYRGSEHDVLDRYYRAAAHHDADVVIRITSDCPLIDPALVGKVLTGFLSSGADYASNFIKRSYPRGLEAEAMSFTALHRAWVEATQDYERTHVTPYIYLNPDKFVLHSVESELGTRFASFRWTVDTAADLEFVRQVYAMFDAAPSLSWSELAFELERCPHLLQINAHVQQKRLTEL